MSAAASLESTAVKDEEPIHVTLLELVEAVSDVTDNDLEVVATVLHMLESGRIRLNGNFRGFPLEALA